MRGLMELDDPGQLELREGNRMLQLDGRSDSTHHGRDVSVPEPLELGEMLPCLSQPDLVLGGEARTGRTGQHRTGLRKHTQTSHQMR